MFEALDLRSAINAVELYGQTPNWLYSYAAGHCFRKNLSGPAADSLRRCLVHHDACSLNRLTPEWDALIQLG